MTNYLLSIDPSIKNTGFTLWEKRCHVIDCENNNCIEIKLWIPIWIKSFNFKKQYDFHKEIKWQIHDLIEITRKISRFNFVIERGTFHSKNGIGYETQEHLRGFIAGQFNKLITKDMLISPKEWQNWYLKKYFNELENKKMWNDKEISFSFALRLIAENNWNITISNHDEADSLLIGWYYLNKENK
ncbi:hypothetical protein [Spiroplasma endosymbiont of Danaus chrysippus]|uniref:hypothetical protein n=1 Tax=Spiroplasma endosymbiont of Danaus chrysippus TaxID=2691041 RepID=UPI0013C9D51D|nr:hypothetical protein [Spiroplasma endosymbiont of Danaus chrysippus]CAB1054975.1 hypothetical protein [Spiroplasma endosymbiont of Danaus chrysippus]